MASLRIVGHRDIALPNTGCSGSFIHIPNITCTEMTTDIDLTNSGAKLRVMTSAGYRYIREKFYWWSGVVDCGFGYSQMGFSRNVFGSISPDNSLIRGIQTDATADNNATQNIKIFLDLSITNQSIEATIDGHTRVLTRDALDRYAGLDFPPGTLWAGSESTIGIKLL